MQPVCGRFHARMIVAPETCGGFHARKVVTPLRHFSCADFFSCAAAEVHRIHSFSCAAAEVYRNGWLDSAFKVDYSFREGILFSCAAAEVMQNPIRGAG